MTEIFACNGCLTPQSQSFGKTANAQHFATNRNNALDGQAAQRVRLVLIKRFLCGIGRVRDVIKLPVYDTGLWVNDADRAALAAAKGEADASN